MRGDSRRYGEFRCPSLRPNHSKSHRRPRVTTNTCSDSPLSISFRVLLASDDDDGNPGEVRSRWEAYSHWKRYLRGSRSGINPYTQHVYVVIDKGHGLHKALGGGVLPEQSLVLSQIGPLFIVGHLDPKIRPPPDGARTWRNLRIRLTGGTISPVKGWKFEKIRQRITSRRISWSY